MGRHLGLRGLDPHGRIPDNVGCSFLSHVTWGGVDVIAGHRGHHASAMLYLFLTVSFGCHTGSRGVGGAWLQESSLSFSLQLINRL